MSSQESQRAGQEMEDDDGLAAGPLLVTKLQACPSWPDAFFFELDAFSYSVVLTLLFGSLGIWY